MEETNTKLEEFNKYIVDKKVAIIGIGVSNIPLLEYFNKKGAKVTVFDRRNIENIDKNIIDTISNYCMGMSFGVDYLSKLHGFDIIFRSPSCRPDTKEIEEEVNRGAILTSEIEMLMKMCPGTIIGITGSDGKTTTTSLIYEIIKQKGYNCYLGGNIGIPLFTKIDEMKKDDIIILELSSFQLMDMEISPNISIITNITPNHLDIHKSYEEYIESKKNIFKYQNKDGILILNYDNDITREFEKEANGKVIFFSSKTKLENGIIYDDEKIKSCENGIRRHILNTKNIYIKGIHNFENICAAIAATAPLVDIDTQSKIITEFKGVHHRLEFVRDINGVKWYNDSASSSPTRTIAGISAFNEELVLITGGYDKNLDYTPMAKPIVDKVKTLILIGQTSEKIYNAVKQEMKNQNKVVEIYKCDSLQDAIDIANELAWPEEVVLFSPGSASFDMFKNAYQRGDIFKELVNKIEE
ncbi:MAG: UDP-N-acetylmuramoyl-L-alanine--D-glutamate ligase [Clostridia bacterium]|nr:UDP-N-acetylmuramoyl-L-alanine--D-glutamate ligase [Clostridia bacterium]